MPRYYFHLQNRVGHVPDQEGLEVSGRAEARQQAISNIRSIVSEDVRNGLIDLNGRIEIADESGRSISVVTFIEAFEVTAGAAS